MKPSDLLQSRALVAGAAVDVAFGAVMLLAPEAGAGVLGLELPSQRVWFDLVGVLLLIVACAYLVARRHEATLQPMGLVAGVGRALGAFVMARHALAGAGAAIGACAIVDALLAGTHLAAFAASRRRPR